MNRRTFLKGIFPVIFVPKLIVPIWKVIKPAPIYGSFDKFIFPTINGVFPSLLPITNLVSVQPMSMPSAQIFYMDFVTTSNSDDDNFLHFEKI